MQNEVKLSTGFDRKSSQFACSKKFTALKTPTTHGLLSGAAKLLFNNNFNLQIERTFVDPSGRFIICDVKANDKSLTLANIYAPNDDKPAFFLDFFGHLDDFKCDELIIGDFNLVLDLEKDKSGGLPKTHQNCLKIIKEFSEKLDPVDIWRALHPETTRFTWRRRSPKV